MYIFQIVLTLSLIFLCKAGYVDNLSKCSMTDDKCLNNLFQTLLAEVSKEGIKELGIPQEDPTKVQNINANIIDDVTIFMPEAFVKGIKNCKYEYNHIDVPNKVARQTVLCDLSVKGAFTLSGKSAMLQGLLGVPKIDGSGNIKIKLEKIRLKFTLPFNLVRTSDSTIHAHLIREKASYEYEVRNVVFSGEKIMIGKSDITKLVIGYLNENWKQMLEKSGKSLTDKAIDTYLDIAEKFFVGVPANKFLIEDTAQYL